MYQGFQTIGNALLWRIHQRERGLVIMPMHNNAGRRKSIAINHQYDHLAITLLGAVVRARTGTVIEKSHVQIESLHNLKTGLDQIV
jgi:hypothetical protein